jgi:TetR/AcrR family transcriptional regulator, tetracycline repressor protein
MADRQTMATLTKPRIIDAALDVIDDLGLDGLTMRALADNLGVTATALYYHFASRDELLAALVERHTSKLITGTTTDGQWDDRIRTLLVAMVNELTRHPDLAVWIITTQARQPSVLRIHDTVLGILLDAGFAPADAIEAKGILFRYIIGHLVLADAAEGMPWQQIPKRYTHLRSVGPIHDTIDRAALFYRGLDTILGGLDNTTARRLRR